MTQRATIVFQDTEDGQVNVNLTFDPPIDPKNPASPAVQFALIAMQRASDSAEEETDHAESNG